MSKRLISKKIAHLIEIFVKLPSGETFTIECDQRDNCVSIKKKIFEISSIPIDKQRLIFQGEELIDETLLHFYYIKDGSLIDLQQ